MFWKWKRKGNPEGHTPAFFEAPEERRHAYRVTPDTDAPVTLCIDGELHRAHNVSAGGAALVAATLPDAGQIEAILHLPDGEPDETVLLEILRTSGASIRHCRFLDLSTDLQDRLFRYVLEREKEIIRARHP